MHNDVVRLAPEAREPLLAIVHTGRVAAVKLRHARVLRKAEGEVGGRRWANAESAEALDTSVAPVHRVCQTWGAQGLEAALARKRPTGRPYRNLEGVQEAQLTAGAWSAPPEGRVRWPLA